MKTCFKVIMVVAISACSFFANAQEGSPKEAKLGFVVDISTYKAGIEGFSEVYLKTSKGNVLGCGDKFSKSMPTRNFIELAKLSMIFQFEVSNPENKECNIKIEV